LRTKKILWFICQGSDQNENKKNTFYPVQSRGLAGVSVFRFFKTKKAHARIVAYYPVKRPCFDSLIDTPLYLFNWN